MKRFVVAAATMAAAGALLTVAVPSAMAATSQGGTDVWRSSRGEHQPAPSTAGTPTAAGSATAYNGACGTGYNVIDSAALGSLGTVYLTYNGSSNCVATVRSNPGTKLYMVAAIKLSGTDSWLVDEGQYTTYAGPVYLRGAAGRCIDWGGEIDGVYVQKFGTHCG